jgi:hypothetical protein
MSEERPTESEAVEMLVRTVYSPVLAGDRPLFHYTSLTGLVGVLKEGELWASELRSVNDTTELTLGIDLLAQQAASRVTDDRHSVAGQLLNWIESRARFGPMIFSVAFTEQGNLLSQWRGYCPAGAGVSFGLSFGHVASCAADNAFRLGKCIYDPARQNELAKTLTDHLIAAAEKDGPNSKLPTNQSFHSTFYRLEEHVLHWCALMKHRAFEAEDEWRAVSAPHLDSVTGPGASIRYRVGQSMLVPYIALPLRNRAGIVPIDTVITGPTPHPERASESVQRLVAGHMKNLHGPWVSRYCQIPYRAW